MSVDEFIPLEKQDQIEFGLTRDVPRGDIAPATATTASAISSDGISCPNRGAFQAHKDVLTPDSRGVGEDEMDAMLVGAPFGLGVLIALGVLLAVMNHLSP